MANYTKTPVLAKIKIGDQYYWLKDDDARALLTAVEGRVGAIEADYLTAADKTALEDLIDAEETRAIAAEAQVLADAKEYTDAEVAKIKTIKYEIVSALPTAGADYDFNVCKTVYLVSEGEGKEKDYYGEYICLNKGTAQAPSYAWEKIGDTRIDLSNYYTKTEINGKVTTLEGLISAEETRATGVEGALDTKIDGVAADLAEEATRADTAEKANAAAIAAEVQRATGKEGELNTAIQANATAITEEEERAEDVEEGLQLAINGLDDRVEAIEDKEDGWDAKLDNIKINGAFKEVKSDVTGKGNYVDLGSIATDERVADLEDRMEAAEDDIDALESGKEDKSALKALAYKDSASGTVAGQTISGVKATGTTTGALTGDLAYTSTAIESTGSVTTDGTIAVVLDQTSTPITSTGSVTADGSVAVTLENNTVSEITSVGELASYTKENVTGGKATVIDTSKFSGGTQADFVQGSKANLTTSNITYVEEGIKAEVGTGADAECLIISSITTKSAKAVDTFTANGDDTFTKNTVASIGDGFYTAGSDVVYTPSQYTDAVLPTKANKTVGVASAAFTGSSVDISVSGNYDKATVNATGTKFTGKAVDVSVSGNYDKANKGTVAFQGASVTLDVGNITVAAKDVTVE